MKKLNYLLLAMQGLGMAALGLAMTSCSQDNPQFVNNGGDSSNVKVTLNFPKDIATRAEMGTGSQANQIYTLIYEVTGSTEPTYTYVDYMITPFTSGSSSQTLDFNLVTNKTYQLVFFAGNSNVVAVTNTTGSTTTPSNPSNPVYTLDASYYNLNVNYSYMTAAYNNQDNYDCFYTTYNTGLLDGKDLQANVDLTRPVAQLNWGTLSSALTSTQAQSIWGTAGNYYIQATFNAPTGVPSTLDLISGTTSNNTTAVEFQNFITPANSDATFPTISNGNTYTYVAMQYLLAPVASTTADATTYTIDATLTVNNGGNSHTNTDTKTIEVSNIPLQANYQTNIYGSLLAANVSFTVTKQPGFQKADPVSLWDGTVTLPVVNTTTKEVNVNSASELAGLAAIINGEATQAMSRADDTPVDGSTPNSLEGYTIYLNCDYDMNGESLIIGTATRSSSTVTGNLFSGTLDGQGHTISNLTIVSDASANEAVGFIAALSGNTASVKNLNFKELNVTGANSETVGGVVGAVTNGATVSGVTVESGNISGKRGVGGIVGRVLLNGNVENCNNYATVTSTGDNTGGVIGAAYYTASGSVLTVSGCNNYGAVSGQSQGIGGVIGLSAAVVSNCTNSGDVTGATTSTGGVIGQQMSAGSVTGCENTGTVVGGTGYGSGGIIGWVRYQTDGYPRQQIIEVSGNKNSGLVSGAQGVGGIVGMWYLCGVCYGNTNTAANITASGSFSAGIIGGSQWTEGGTLNSTLDNPDGISDASMSMLYVQSNYTTTSQMSNGNPLSSYYIYINTLPQTAVNGNSMKNAGIVDTPFSASLNTPNDPANSPVTVN